MDHNKLQGETTAPERSESTKKKAKEEAQLSPKDCTVPTYGEKPKFPPHFDALMKIAEKYPIEAVDLDYLFKTKPRHTTPAPYDPDPNFDYTQFDDGPKATTPVPRPGADKKKAAILEREKEWAEEAKAEREKSAEQKEMEAKTLADYKKCFIDEVDAFYAGANNQ